jgi:predicted metal-dependent peptidase
MDNSDFRNILRKCVLNIQAKNVFFGVLCAQAPVIITKEVPTAATDGKNLLFNEEFMMKHCKNQAERNAIFLHEVLHIAFRHVFRRGTRDARIWNIAADIVVNGIVKKEFSLPEGGIVYPELEAFSVEDVYEKLIDMADKKISQMGQERPDLGDGKSQMDAETGEMKDLSPSDQAAAKAEQTQKWKDAVESAKEIFRQQNAGKNPLGASREISHSADSRVPWKHLLWDYITSFPSDFGDYDRRHIHRGIYAEELLSDSLRVDVVIDTSGSVDDRLLAVFYSELMGICRSYPHVKASLWFADHDAYGPYEFEIGSGVTPKGGGGTSFRPYFEKSRDLEDPASVVVYMTDGYGEFPSAEEIGNKTVLWAACPGSADDSAFQNGRVIHISAHD